MSERGEGTEGSARQAAVSDAARHDEQPAAQVSDPAGEALDAPPIWSTDVPAADPQDPPDAAADPAPEPDTGPPSRLLRPRNLVLLGLAVVALVVAAVFGPVAWEMWSEKNVRIATPPRVAGLALDDSQGARDTIDYLRTAVETGVSLKNTIGAVYADEAGESRSVLFVGGTGVLVSPDQALTKTFGLITDDAGGVDSVHDVSAGPLGGVMKCGSTKTDGGSMAVCGWADHGSLGVAMFPNRPVDQSAELLRTMRTAMQNRR
jgi:hypothetical protein